VRSELQEAEAPVSSLDLADRVPLAGDAAVYRFDQQRDGILVDGGEAIVLDAEGDGADLVADDTEAGVAPPGAPRVGSRRAIAIAVEDLGARGLTKPARAELVIHPAGDGVLAWLVSVSSERPLGAFEVLVDAGSGSVIETRDLIWDATGQASIFVPNAVVENGGYEQPPGTYDIADRKDRDSDALTALRTPVTLERLNEKRPCLKGKYAEVRLGRKAKRVCRAGRDWSTATREGNRFEALMAYFHVDATQTYLEDDLGAPGVDDERQVVLANSITDDNSFYMRDAIRLGTGGVDDGEDADVIVHEYGHAVQDTQRPGFGSCWDCEAGAMGEGFGDYLAEALSEESGAVEPDPECVMEWDAVSYDIDTMSSPGICLRRTDVNRSVSEQRDFCEADDQGRNEIHCVGEVWSSALWELRQEVGDEGGQSVMDRIVMTSHPMLSRRASFAQAVSGLLSADEVLYPVAPDGDGIGAHCAEIRAEAIQRQFLPAYDCTP
jgi:Zn-dependent metalloprotease